MRVIVDHPQGDGDAGMMVGGLFEFAPAGEDGDRHQANEHAARVIMSDPGLSEHFECTPPLPGLKAGTDGPVIESKKGKGKRADDKPAADDL
jgi:hypothetical protein